MNEKLDMQSPDWTNLNTQFIAERFPNCVTETYEGKKIDFDLLKQELSKDLIEGAKERYRLEWPGKKEAIVTANIPTTKTLRPIRNDSVDFDNTENVYIEGDNLEVLKLLQESYLGKIKMIYIDPPYNTGKDFIYKDNFTKDKEEELKQSGQKDEYNQRLVVNPETNGRYHSDWLTMMYPRLKLARNLLANDGVIFISIDDNEVHNLRKLCDEIFGEVNFVGDVIRKTKSQTNDAKNGLNYQHEFVLIFAKNKQNLLLQGESKDFTNYKNPDNDPSGRWVVTDPSARSGGPNGKFEIKNHITGTVDLPPQGRYWAFSKLSFENWIKTGKVVFKKEIKDGERGFIVKKYLSEIKNDFKQVDSLFGTSNDYMNQVATKELNDLLYDLSFTFPKPIYFIYNLLKYSTSKDSLILDFFSGSATTAHAVMELNKEDGGNRKYILVQVPEPCEETSEAYKAGYKNICEIGKERIRRAAKKIKEENNANIDYGFKVYRLADSNMEDVYYQPKKLQQTLLDKFYSNIKSDRTPDDLVTQIMLDWGLLLSNKIEQVTILNKQVYKIADNSLFICFDNKINEEFIKELSKEKPLKIVFKDACFKDDTDKQNVLLMLKQLSPNTEMKVM